MKKLSAVAAAVVALAAAAPAAASVVDFQDVTSGTCAGAGTSLTSRGFSFTGNPADGGLFVCNTSVLAQNASAALINANSRSILTMRAANGAAFSVQSFEAGTRTPDYAVTTASGTMAATGVLVEGLSGATVVASTSFTFTGQTFRQYSLTDAFRNLSSIRFTAQGTTAAPEFAIDNIRVNEAVAAVPEPATWALLLLGFGMVGAATRRRRAPADVAFA